MKIAVISDIHGNLLAMEKFLQIAKKEAFDEIICLGDVLDPFSDSLEVYELLKTQRIPLLRGNHEDYTIVFHKDVDDPKWVKADKRSIALVAKRMGAERAKELEQLPYFVERELSKELRVFFCHASPFSNSESYFDQWNSNVKESLKKVDAEIVVGGHKHVCFERTFESKKLLIAPSLGIPQSGIPRPQFLVLEYRNQKLQHRFESFDYHPEAVVTRYLDSQWFEQGAPFSWLLADEILSGRKRVGPLLRRMKIKFGSYTSNLANQISEDDWRQEIREYLIDENRMAFLESFTQRKYC